MVCGNFILPEPASYVFFYALFNLRKLLYIIKSSGHRVQDVTISYNYIGILPANLLYDVMNGKAA